MSMSRLLGYFLVVLLSVAVVVRAEKDAILLQAHQEKQQELASDGIIFHDKHGQQSLVQSLSDMGFTSVALRLMASDLLIGVQGPFTIFAPTEQAFQNHGHHFSEQALAHHIVQGLFTYADLQAMPYGIHLHGILDDVIAITTTGENENDDAVSVNGVLVSPTNFFSSEIPLIIIHAVDAFLTHND